MVSTFIKKQMKGVLLTAALISMGSMKAQLNLTWSEMGPNDIAGRSRAIIVDKTDPSGKKLFAAGVSGGIFKTIDNGSHWSPVNDLAPSLIVSCMDQNSNGDVFFGTGETFALAMDGAGSSGFIGSGLYKILSNTSNIVQVQTASSFGNINEIAIDASNNIYLATDAGFFISTDGGTTFSEETISATSTLSPMATDVKISKNGDVYYSSYAATTSTTGVSYVYVRPYGSSTFNNITPSAITSINRGRIEISPSPVNPNYVYLSVSKFNGDLAAVLVSDNKGSTWATITLGTVQFDPFLGGGNYSNTIVADPIKADACYLGSFYFYAWSQLTGHNLGQGNWSQIGTPVNIPLAVYIHSYIHDVKFNLAEGAVYIATDGGIFKSVSGYSGFLAFNKGFNVSQFNSVAFPNFPRNTLSGTNSNVAVPYAGVIGGSIGNSLTYIPGYFPQNGVMASTSFGVTDAFQSDFSRILPKTAFYAGSFGSILRSNDIDVSPFSTFYDQSYKGAGPTSTSPGKSSFANQNTPFRLWENYNTTDSVIFYNEITKTKFTNNNTSKTTFLSNSTRSQASAKYDTIFVSAVSGKGVPVPTQTIAIIPVYSGTNIASLNIIGDANTTSTVNNVVYLNSSLIDSVKYTFLAPPDDSSTVSLTFKFRYDAGSVITVLNKDISGNNFNTSVTLANTLYATASATSMPTVKLPLRNSARIATGVNAKTSAESPSVFVVKRPLNFSINPDWVKIAGKNSRIDGPGGVASTTVMPVLGTTVTRLEWAHNGQSIYFSTKQNDTTYYVYRISHLDFIGDSADADYGGIFTSDVDSVNVNTMRKKPGQRTTALGRFKYPVTSISLTNDDKTLLVTLGSYNNKTSVVYSSISDVTLLSMNNTDASNFASKHGNLPLIPAYSSLVVLEGNGNNKAALVGTESGIYSTNDITAGSPTWTKESGGNFPNVPVFQIRQQTFPSYKCYNTGIIYAATHGRGIWSTDKFHVGQEYAIGINENGESLANTNSVLLFPNPTADKTNIRLQASENTSYSIKIYDISGRTLSLVNTPKLMAGENVIELNTSAFNSGVYFVSVEGSNNFKATTKLVISK